tara:strand:- start:99 stop:968 length:870 start_codon:yes stop_codon:yes gene_type:complete
MVDLVNAAQVNLNNLGKIFSGRGGGKSAPGGNVLGGGINFKMPKNFVTPNNIFGINTDQDFRDIDLGPIQDIGEAALQTAQLPFKAVEDISKIDAGKVVKDVAAQAIKLPEQVIGDAEPAIRGIADAAANTILTVTQIPEDIGKIDAVKVAGDVVTGAANLVTETPKNLVTIAEEAVLKPASDLIGSLGETLGDAGQLFIDNVLSPFQPGETEGTGSGQATGGDNLASAPTLADPGVIPEMEQATTKAGQMTEEERLRRMRRLLLNRYGREDTILSGGGDTKSRRRYAL